MRKSLRCQQGTRSRVAPKKLTPELVTDARHLILAVFEIERCWAYAMQLRAEANSEPRKRFHMISRLRKGAKNAQLLGEVMANVPMCGAQTKLELTAYIQWITGILHFEKQVCLLFGKPDKSLCAKGSDNHCGNHCIIFIFVEFAHGDRNFIYLVYWVLT